MNTETTSKGRGRKIRVDEVCKINSWLANNRQKALAAVDLPHMTQQLFADWIKQQVGLDADCPLNNVNVKQFLDAANLPMPNTRERAKAKREKSGELTDDQIAAIASRVADVLETRLSHLEDLLTSLNTMMGVVRVNRKTGFSPEPERFTPDKVTCSIGASDNGDTVSHEAH